MTLHRDGAVRWVVDYANEKSDPPTAWQEVWEMPFALNVNGDLPGWALPGTVIASFNLSSPANVTNSFMARQGGVANAYPVTESGRIVLLDAGGDKVARNHLGAIARGGTELAWTASPFGEWALVQNWTLVDDGTGTGNLTNITTYYIDKPGGIFGSGNPGLVNATPGPLDTTLLRCIQKCTLDTLRSRLASLGTSTEPTTLRATHARSAGASSTASSAVRA